MTLPDLARHLIDKQVFASLATVNPNGSAQSSVIWLKHEHDDIVFSTIKGRRKALNMERDPRVSVLIFDPENPYRYVEVRGTVGMSTAGGPELINELSLAYEGKPFHERQVDSVRLVCRLTPTKVITR